MEFVLFVKYGGKTYSLSDPISASRQIHPNSGPLPQAFGLPQFRSTPVKMGSFIGDVTQGGSCNVPIYQFTPHNLTHIETPAHISSYGRDMSHYPAGFFSGLAKLIDLSVSIIDDKYILPLHVPQVLENEIDIIIFKTRLSLDDPHTDYTGTDPIAFHPQTLQELITRFPRLKLLVCDLPSLDKEDDGGKLKAHRQFFELYSNKAGALRAVIEFAYLKNLSQGIYFLQATPARIQSDSMITDVLLYSLSNN